MIHAYQSSFSNSAIKNGKNPYNQIVTLIHNKLNCAKYKLEGDKAVTIIIGKINNV